jgi:Golgi nucleoside diphosphatase
MLLLALQAISVSLSFLVLFTSVCGTARLFDHNQSQQHHHHEPLPPPSYSIVLDAGSGGTRMFVYQLLEEGSELQVTALTRMSVDPGLSTFVSTPELAAGYLQPLFDHAIETISAEHHSDTPVFIKSTAGMRLVPEQAQQQVSKRFLYYSFTVLAVNTHYYSYSAHCAVQSCMLSWLSWR